MLTRLMDLVVLAFKAQLMFERVPGVSEKLTITEGEA